MDENCQMHSPGKVDDISWGLGGGLMAWLFLLIIDARLSFSNSTHVWLLGSLLIAIMFSLLLRKPIDLLFGAFIAAYMIFIGKYPGLIVLPYFIWSFYRQKRYRLTPA